MCASPAAQKTALIVYAHQSQASFNAAVCNVTTQALTEQGYRVIVSDLYAMNFRASATQDDIIGDLAVSNAVVKSKFTDQNVARFTDIKTLPMIPDYTRPQPKLRLGRGKR